MEFKVKYEVEHVVAHRRLERTHPAGKVTPIDVSIGDVVAMPAEHSNSSEYGQAWLEITGAGFADTCRRVNGADTMQAVLLAMQLAGLILDDADCVGEIEADEVSEPANVTQFGFPLFPKREE